jgi:hypothetical protein
VKSNQKNGNDGYCVECRAELVLTPRDTEASAFAKTAPAPYNKISRLKIDSQTNHLTGTACIRTVALPFGIYIFLCHAMRNGCHNRCNQIRQAGASCNPYRRVNHVRSGINARQIRYNASTGRSTKASRNRKRFGSLLMLIPSTKFCVDIKRFKSHRRSGDGLRA